MSQSMKGNNRMTRKATLLGIVGALATASVLIVTTSYAQTSGTERRGERREDRQGARDEKQACKAGDEKSRPECRQDKRDEKQEGRRDGGDDDDKKPAEEEAGG
jgi:ribosomal protein S17